MKKLLFFAAIAALSSLASCGNGGNADNAIQADTIYINETSVTPVDSDSVLVTNVQAEGVVND